MVSLMQFFKASLSIQEAKLGMALEDLKVAQGQLDEKQAELDEAQAEYDEAMREKQVSYKTVYTKCFVKSITKLKYFICFCPFAVKFRPSHNE